MKRLLPLLALAVLVSACVKTPETTRFSILGDSFSAFQGYVYPDTNEAYPHYNDIGVTGPEQMWWSQVADSTGWDMERNNSFSGALMCNFDDFETGDHYGPNSFIHRMNNLGNPHVIFVFGATNDIYHRAPLGDYVYSGWTEEQLCSFRPGLAYILEILKHQHPRAKIYLLVDMELCISDVTIDDETRQAYLESIHSIANHYNVNCIDIYDIHKSWWHPDPEGQEDIARQVIEALRVDFNF
jgi:hypothetical protein